MEHNNLALGLRSYSSETRIHQHDYHQLVLPVEGRLRITVGSNGGDVSNEQAAVIQAGRDHSFSSQHQNCFLVADVPVALAPDLERLPAFIPLDKALVQYIAFLHQQLLQEGGSKNGERQMLLLLIQLLRERFGGKIYLDRRVEAARAYIDTYFFKSISLDQLARIANLSKRQLSELFRHQLGMTPLQYQTEKRMQLAWQMLEAGKLSVQLVADKVGYGSLPAFCDRFRKHFGHSPRHFRRIGK